MARQIDPARIQKLKKAVVELVVEYGVKGVDIAELSKRTGISAGYLYRHYKNKDALIEQTISEGSGKLVLGILPNLRRCSTIEECIAVLMQYLVGLLESNVLLAKFLMRVFFDDSIEVQLPERSRIIEVIEPIVQMEKRNGKINSEFSSEHVFEILESFSLCFFGITLNSRKRNYIDCLVREKETMIKKITEMCLIALR